MANFRVKVLALAESDLMSIWNTISDFDERSADQFLLLLGERISSLHDFPDRGASRPEIGKGIRILIEGKYLIIYRKSSASVEVVRVIHGAMSLKDIKLL